MKGYLADVCTMINDTISGKIGLFTENVKAADEGVREMICDIMGGNELTRQSFRNNKNAFFTITENILKVNLPLAWEGSPFFKQFVEIRNGALGDKNEFVVDRDSTLVASRFSGGHWDIDRRKLQGKRSFSVDTEWISERVYDDWERFMKGLVSLSDMVLHLQKSFINNIDARIYSTFNGMGTYLPSAFKESGTYDRETLNNLIQRVQIASQQEVVIAGTRSALSHVIEGIPTAWISNSQKEELATTGMVVENIGLPAKCVQIPQVFIRGTYDFKINNNALFVLPGDERMIKLFYEGDVYTKESDEKENHDMTIDIQSQVKVGIGLICSSLCGRYDLE